MISAVAVNVTATVACTAFAALATVLVRALARRLAAVKPPHPLVPAHVKPVPCLGGAAICAAAGTGIALAGVAIPRPILVGTLLFLATGVIDDLRSLTVRWKLLLQMGCALVPVLLGLSWHLTGSAPLDKGVTVLWILLLVNALNVTDVCDGLVGGLTIVSLLGIASMDPAAAPVCLLLSAACVGFLPFNLPPATIFLGESGTASLGFLLAALSVGAAAQDSSAVRIVAAALAVAVPLFELVFLVIVRSRKRLRCWNESADHIALRLQAAGNSTWRTDCVMWLLAAGMAMAGHYFLIARWQSRLMVGVVVAAAVALCSILLVKRAPAAPAFEHPG